jgi:hypothetical protein
MIDAPFEATLDDDLVLPAVSVFGEYAANGLVTLRVAADAFERRGDVEDLMTDAEVLGQLPATRRAEARGIPLREHDAVHAVLTQRLYAQRRAHRAVDATRHGHHETAPAHVFRENFAQPRADVFDDGVVVHLEDVGVKNFPGHGFPS